MFQLQAATLIHYLVELLCSAGAFACTPHTFLHTLGTFFAGLPVGYLFVMYQETVGLAASSVSYMCMIHFQIYSLLLWQVEVTNTNTLLGLIVYCAHFSQF